MADEFKIVASLDIPKSADKINKDIPKLKGQAKHLKIVADLNPTLSLKNIQATLNKMNNNANIKIGIDASGFNSTLSDVQNKVIATNKGLSIKPTVDGKVIEDTDVLIKTIVSKLQTLNTVDLKTFKDNLKNIIGVSSKEISADAETLIQTLKLNPEDSSAIIQSYEFLMDSIRNTMSSMGKDKIVSGSSFDNNIVTSIYKAATSFKEVQSQAQQTANIITNANNQVANSVRTISTQYRTEFGVVTDVIKQAETEFARFGEVSAVSNKSVKALNGVPEHFRDFTIQVKSATGEVQKFFYTFENVGDNKNPVFKYMLQNINEADAGVKRLADDIEKAKAQYTSKLAGFESTNSQIKTGLSAEIAKVNEEINKLGANNGSIQNLKVAFDNLTASANKIKENLKATGASLNPIDNAINKYKNMDNVLKEMTTSFNNLAIKPTGLDNSLNSIKSQLIELQNLEKSEGGYTETWAKKYRDVSIAVAEVKTNIELALKTEKSDKGSSYQTQLKYLNKIKEETNTIISFKRKMVNAGDEEKALYQHEITNAQKRIQYDVKQLEKKKLLTNEAQYLVNTYKEEIALQDRINNAKLNDKASAQRITDIKSYNAEIDKAITKLSSLNNSSVFSKNASNPQVTQTKQEINSLITAYQNLETKLQGDITPDGLETVRDELAQLNESFNDVTTNAERFEAELKSNNEDEQLAQKVKILNRRIEAYQSANPKAAKEFRQEFSDMIKTLSNPDIDLSSYNKVAKQLQIIKIKANEANLAGKTLWQTIKEKAGKFVGWMSITGIISTIWREMRRMVTNVIELDTAMASLKRVTNETDASYSKFLSNAIAMAKELKISIADLVAQTAEWAKKGYSLDDSQILAKASGIYSVVGDVDNATAVQHLTTVMKTYNMTVEDAIGIVDRFNNISNKYSVTSADIGEMLSNSITSLYVAGNSLDEAIAMGTTITEVTADSSEAGNTLKVLSMRLRGATTEIEKMGESTDGMAVSTSKLREKILALTNVDGTGGFDILTETGDFKSTYQIMQGISEVWEDISSVNQAALLELIAGKQRGNTVSTLLTNMAQSNNILNDSLNSSGSALKEYNVYLDSLEGKIQGFKTAFEAMSSAVADDDFLKGAVDLGTEFLNVLTEIIKNLGGLPTLLSMIVGGYASVKNVGLFKTFETDTKKLSDKIGILGKSFKTISTEVEESLEGVEGRFKRFGTRISSFFKSAFTSPVITQADSIALQQYANALLDGKENSEEITQAMAGVSQSAQDQAKKIEELYKQFKNHEITQEQYIEQSNLAAQSTKKLSLAQKAATITSKALKAALNTMVVTAIIQAVITIIQKFTEFVNSYSSSIETLKEKNQELEDIKSEIESLNDELATSKQRLIELNAIENPTLIEQEEIDKLKEANEELERQLRLKGYEEFKSANEANADAQANWNDLNSLESTKTNWYDFVPFVSSISALIKTIKDDVDTINVNSNNMRQNYLTDYANAILDRSILNTKYDMGQVDDETYKNELARLENEISERQAKLTDFAQEYTTILNGLDPDDEQNKEAIDFINKFLNKYDYWFNYGTDNGLTRLTSIIKSANYTEVVAKLKELATQGELTIDSFKNTEGIDKFINAISQISSVVGEDGVLDDSDIQKVIDSIVQISSTSDDGADSIDLLTNSLANFKDTYDKVFSTQSKIQSAFDKIQEGATLTSSEVMELIELCSDVSPEIATLFTQVGDGYTISLEDLKNVNDDVISEIKKDLEKHIEDLKKAKAETHNAILDPANFINNFPDFPKLIENDKKFDEQIAETNLLLTMFGLTAETTAEKFDKLTESSNKIVSNINSVSSAFQEQNENGKLSAATILSLIENGYAAALMYDEQTGAVTLCAEAFLELAEAELEAQIQALNAEIAIAKTEKLDNFRASVRAMRNENYELADSYLAISIAAGKSIEDAEAQILALKQAQTNLGSIVTGNGDNKETSTVLNTYDKIIDGITSATDKRIDALNKEKEALEAKNDEEERTNKLLQAQIDLENARKKYLYVYKEGQGFVKVQDEKAIKEAEENLSDIKKEQQTSAIDSEIEKLEKYKEEFANLSSDVQNDFNESFAKSVLNTDNLTNLSDAIKEGIVQGYTSAFKTENQGEYKSLPFDAFLQSLGATVTSEQANDILSNSQSSRNGFSNIIKHSADSVISTAQTINNNGSSLSIEKVEINVDGSNNPEDTAQAINRKLLELTNQTRLLVK